MRRIKQDKKFADVILLPFSLQLQPKSSGGGGSGNSPCCSISVEQGDGVRYTIDIPVEFSAAATAKATTADSSCQGCAVPSSLSRLRIHAT